MPSRSYTIEWLTVTVFHEYLWQNDTNFVIYNESLGDSTSLEPNSRRRAQELP